MTGTEGVCEALTAMLKARTEWDEAPGLYFIYREDGQIHLSPKPVFPDEMWTMGVPTHVLAAIATNMEADASILSVAAPPDLVGAMFFCEMWTVHAPVSDPAAVARAYEAADARKVHKLRGRVEQRIAWAVTRDGAQYVAMQARGEKVIEARKLAGLSGLIPESLARIVRAFSSGLN